MEELKHKCGTALIRFFAGNYPTKGGIKGLSLIAHFGVYNVFSHKKIEEKYNDLSRYVADKQINTAIIFQKNSYCGVYCKTYCAD